MNKPLDTTLFDKAAQFAIEAHHGTERRGKGFPYILHPMEAAIIVSSITNDPEMLAAAILHDTVEDTDATIEQIEELFGKRVAQLVNIDTAEVGLPWRTKRQKQMERIAASNRDSKIVAIGDKLSNLRGITRDYCKQGEELWKRFHAPGGKADIVWYYSGLATALADLADTAPYKEYLTLLEKITEN